MPKVDFPPEKKRSKDDIPVYSTNDVIDAYDRYDASEEAKEPILWFLSELTGKSIDALSVLRSERGKRK